MVATLQPPPFWSPIQDRQGTVSRVWQEFLTQTRNVVVQTQTDASGLHATTVDSFGAVGDGVTNDTAAWQAALDSFNGTQGGILWCRPGATYRIRQTVGNNNQGGVNYGPLLIIGNGATILFDPINPLIDDRAFRWQSSVNGPFDVSGAIARGATSFLAASSADAATLTPGQWVVVYEMDANIGPDVIAIDWLQVASVSAQTVHVSAPCRTAFLGTHLGVKFTPLLTDVHDITMQDLTITVVSSTTTTAALNVSTSRNVLLNRVRVNAEVFCYRAQGLTIRDCQFLYDGTSIAGSECAACVDLTVVGSTFRYQDIAPYNTALQLDIGTAFFGVIGNHFVNAGNIMLEVNYGVHDGVIVGNQFGYTRDESIGGSQAIGLSGCQRIVIAANTIIGGDSISTGIVTSDATITTPQIASEGNVIMDNAITGCDTPISPAAADWAGSIVAAVLALSGSMTIAGALTVAGFTALEDVSANNFEVTSLLNDGDATILGGLNVAEDGVGGFFATIAAGTGNTLIRGTVGVIGDFAINTNKFTVTASNGNTVVAGTLGVTGTSTIAALSATTGTFSSTLAATGDFAINTNKFNVTASNGNTAVAGTLGVTGATTLSGQLAINLANAAGATTTTATTGTNASYDIFTNTGGRFFVGRDNSAGTAIGSAGRAYAGSAWVESNHDYQIGTNNTERFFIEKGGRTGVTNVFQTKGYTVGTLPTGAQGDRAHVTDALAPAFGSAVAAGGGVMVPVYYDGANWKVG